ncbi:MAG: hypothetical protein ACMXYA_01210 [Candidatus Woesearchaeota archaeon]
MKSQTSTEYLIILAVVVIISITVVSFLTDFRFSDSEDQRDNIALRVSEIGINEYTITETGASLLIQNNRPRPTIISDILINSVLCTN